MLLQWGSRSHSKRAWEEQGPFLEERVGSSWSPNRVTDAYPEHRSEREVGAVIPSFPRGLAFSEWPPPTAVLCSHRLHGLL